jgi:hypothetical protein
MHPNTRFLTIALIAGLSGCAANSATTASAPVIATASADVTKAVAFYETAKGIALVAEVAQPSLKPTVDAAIAKLDPIAAAIQTAAPGAAGLATSAAALVDQAVSLEQSTAVAVKAVPAAG